MFSITSRDVLTQIEENGSARITYKVDGFWSSEQLTVYIDRRWGNEWRITYSNSTGGRDTDCGLTDSEACFNFGSAMFDASEKMDYWTNEVEKLDCALAKYNTAIKAKWDEEKKLREEKRKAEAIAQAEKEAVDAPYILDVEDATRLVEKMANNTGVCSYFRRPGEEIRNFFYDAMRAECTTTWKGRKSYYLNDRRISKNKLIAKLSRMVQISQDLPWSYFAK